MRLNIDLILRRLNILSSIVADHMLMGYYNLDKTIGENYGDIIF
jgi:hypothetical protein